MVFETVRGYVELASGLTELTRGRAMEVAHGLLSVPAAGIATGSKVAGQAGALADELMAAAAANRSNLRALVRSEVDVAVTRLGLVPAQKLQEAKAEAARLSAEVARLRAVSSNSVASKTTPRKPAAPRSSVKKAAPARSAVKKAAPAKGAAKKVVPAKSTAKKAAPAKSTAKKVAPARSTAKKVAPARSTAKKAVPRKSSARKSAVTTRDTPAGA